MATKRASEIVAGDVVTFTPPMAKPYQMTVDRVARSVCGEIVLFCGPFTQWLLPNAEYAVQS